jgi:FKBP-type peptidyl-prolyl cis-trans isomerase
MLKISNLPVLLVLLLIAACQGQDADTAPAEAEAVAAESIAAGKAFFAKLAEDADVEISESGLHYKVLDPGTGARPSLTDSVLVHYRGTLIDGTQFDSSYDRGAPATFRLNQVVAGFGEGLTKIGVGGKIILYMPSELGYGNSPRPGGAIKPGDSLIFECELIEVDPG